MRRTFGLVATILTLASPAVADGPVVVELYTSQGCASCPPADEIFQHLSGSTDVIALALHVDYWDYIGWADSFANPAYTQRQQAYARHAGETMIYTPQMVVGGVDHLVGSKPMALADLIRDHGAAPNGVSIALHRHGDRLEITGAASAAFGADAMVQLVRFSPEETVDIRRGENAGRTLTYSNIVTHWDVVGAWDGASGLDMTVPVSGGAPVVVIIQEAGPGAVLAAGILR
jgi:hypothetical protein